MQKNILIIILSVLLVVLIAVAAAVYSSLAEDYVPNDVLPAATTDNAGDATDKAPDFTFADGDGNTLSLSDFFGKPIVINFWATWCPPCKAELPTFNEAFAKYGADVQFIMLNMTDGMRETADGVKKFVADGGYTFPVYYDTALDGAITYAAYSIPMTVFINADGKITATKSGMLSETVLTAHLEFILEN